MDISVIRSDVYKFLDKHKGTYDIIFADPPYDFTQEQFEKIIHTVFEKELLEDDGMLVVEHAPQTKLEIGRASCRERVESGAGDAGLLGRVEVVEDWRVVEQ